MNQITDPFWNFFYSPPPIPSLGVAENIPGLRRAFVDAVNLFYLDGFKDGAIFAFALRAVAFIAVKMFNNYREINRA